jgi:hypothetical protein
MEALLGLSIGALLLSLFIWILPIVLIIGSKKTNGAEKLVWVLAVVFVSWFAWIFYALFAPLGGEKS